MNHKVAELEGALLDAAVAAAEGRQFVLRRDPLFPSSGPIACCPVYARSEGSWTEDRDHEPLAYSTNWALGGPIIDRERISIDHEISEGEIVAAALPDRKWVLGPTSLKAAMRAYCASVHGETVELP